MIEYPRISLDKEQISIKTHVLRASSPEDEAPSFPLLHDSLRVGIV